MQVPLYQVDAFASALFRGNPAAVCPLGRWLADETLQAIAAENNLPETAFYVCENGVPENGRYRLRWFTPTVEVDLCGHATLASAFVIRELRREIDDARVVFDSRSGPLSVEFDSGIYTLDFPARTPVDCPADPILYNALGIPPTALLKAESYLCVYETEDQVRALAPDMAKLASVDCFAAIVTAPGRDCDFVSRFFAPKAGIPEDPVTGSAHSTLIPYWSRRLHNKKLFARQVSSRGGELWCQDRGDRVGIGGHAVRYLEGHITVPNEYVTQQPLEASGGL